MFCDILWYKFSHLLQKVKNCILASKDTVYKYLYKAKYDYFEFLKVYSGPFAKGEEVEAYLEEKSIEVV